ncbi:MAG TPA: HEAT repeat domain-containing protein [Treponemataceae bacterium]|nr:HEAT repeat domain-containing protein [Treponemataceae bacterium]
MSVMRYHSRQVIFAAFFFLLAATLYCEDTVESKRRDVLKYGLEPDIIDLVQTLQSEKNTDYTADLSALFESTRSVSVKNGILALFADENLDALKPNALSVLTDPFDEPKDLVRQILAYVSKLGIKEAAPMVRKLVESENADFRDAAIQTLGKIGSADDAQYMIGLMDSDIPGDEKQRLIVRQNIMAALGDMKAVGIRDKLAEIAKDKDENAVIRASAATALGKMENPEDAPALIALFSETDPLLRTASIAALGTVRTPEAKATILEGFKDSYYKVRLEALGAAEKQQLAEAIPYVRYRAKTDPVPAVRMRAFETLGKFDDAESRAWLLSLVAADSCPDADRAKAADVLVSSDYPCDFTEIEKAVLATFKDDKKIKLRYEFGKVLTKKKDPRPEAIANAFIASKDTITKSIGLDFYDKNRYGSMTDAVKAIAADEKQGALGKRAKKLLGSESAPKSTD